MKKKLVFVILIILAAGALLSSARQEEQQPMKLVNTQSGFVVVEFDQGTIRFGDRFLEAEMRETGIQIPTHKVSEFEGKETIFPDDPLFEKAFVEIYVPLNIASSIYQWR